MQCWYFDKHELRNTPSHKDGMSSEEEASFRRMGVRLLVQVAVDMNLPYSTWASGAVFFHRFFMRNSFRKYNHIAAAACCLFLAGKVEETPKKCRDIVRGFEKVINENEQSQRNEDTASGKSAPQKRSLFAELGPDPKLTILRYERVLLQTILFDLQVDNPYKMLLNYAKRIKGDKKRIEKVVQIAWTFINDSLCTTLCVEWEPEIVACSLLYLACRSAKFEIVDWDGRDEESKPSPSSKCRWLDAFCLGLTVELAEEICHSVLDYYAWLTKQSQPGSGNQTQPAVANAQQAVAGSSQSAETVSNNSNVSPNEPNKVTPTQLAPANPVAMATQNASAVADAQSASVTLATQNAPVALPTSSHQHAHAHPSNTAASAGSSPKRARREDSDSSLRPPSLMNLNVPPPSSIVRATFSVAPQSAPAVAWNNPRFSAPAPFVGAPFGVGVGVEALQGFTAPFGNAFPQANAQNAPRFSADYSRREGHRGSLPSGHR